MRRTGVGAILFLAAAAICLGKMGDAKAPETVVVTFHVRDGKQADMEKLLREEHWPLLRKLDLVFESPHVLVRCTEYGNKTCFKEILTWRDHDTPDNAPAEVEAVWKRMHDFVEKRGGGSAIEI